MLPKEHGFYAFDDGLIVTSADGRRSRVRAPGFAAEPYTPASDEHFRRVQFMATQWGGGYNTKDFLVRQATLGGRWLGLYTEKEAADAGDDGFGDSFANPSSVIDEGSRARRTFWSARIGKTKEFTEGTHDRLFDVTKVPGATGVSRSRSSHKTRNHRAAHAGKSGRRAGAASHAPRRRGSARR